MTDAELEHRDREEAQLIGEAQRSRGAWYDLGEALVWGTLLVAGCWAAGAVLGWIGGR